MIPVARKLKQSLLGAILVILGGLVCKAEAVSGYQAMGYLVYTRFNPSGEVTHKVVRMFDIKVAGPEWRIRTEPVIEGKGIGFYEVSSGTNDFVLNVTGFDAAYRASESPFQDLRREIQESHPAEVFFTNPPPPAMPADYAKLFSPSNARDQSNSNSARSDNIATAFVINGSYPPADQSYAAFVWFAFTPPSPLTNNSDRMLLQNWDDGNRLNNRFRRARWNQFPAPPQLVSDAVYDWVGKERPPDGRLRDLNISDVSKPEDAAATYEVVTATNFFGLTLPVNFKLTRFTPQRSDRGEQVVSSTMTAVVTKLEKLASQELSPPKVPGKTYVSDYRGSGQPDNYILDSDGSRSERP
jgi:hypothetical protein